MTNTLTNICNTPVYAGYPTLLGFFALLEGCVETGICEPHLNSHDYIIMLIVFMKTRVSHILKAAIVIVYPEFSFNSYSLVKGPHSSINSESDP